MFKLKITNQQHWLTGVTINLPTDKYSAAMAYALRIGTELSKNDDGIAMDLENDDWSFIGLRFIDGDLARVYDIDDFDDELDDLDDDGI